MVLKEPINKNSLNEDWAPKGHSHVPMRRKAFPLEDENTEHTIINTGFNASYSQDNGDVIDVAKALDPYLHPKNQIILRALIKTNSIVHDINSLVKLPVDASISEVTIKPLTLKEGLEIAQEMAPYLSPKAKHQVENVTSKFHSINKLKKGLTKVKTAETPEIKMEYILENLRNFMPNEKYNQVKQVVNIVKLFQTSNAMSETKKISQENNEGQSFVEDTEQKENEQLSDIMNLLDKFSNKKNTE